jgi:hypothetical protein
MIVPFPAGGPTDTIGRVLAERMAATLGRPIIVENPVGASGSIGTGRAARATPDGYTLALGNWPTHAINGATYKLNYDVVTDFDAISMISSDPLIISANKSVPSNQCQGSDRLPGIVRPRRVERPRYSAQLRSVPPRRRADGPVRKEPRPARRCAGRRRLPPGR